MRSRELVFFYIYLLIWSGDGILIIYHFNSGVQPVPFISLYFHELLSDIENIRFLKEKIIPIIIELYEYKILESILIESSLSRMILLERHSIDWISSNLYLL